jgi:hypothetical protein
MIVMFVCQSHLLTYLLELIMSHIEALRPYCKQCCYYTSRADDYRQSGINKQGCPKRKKSGAALFALPF